MAEAMQAEFKWDSDGDWRRAGTRIHALEGLFRVEAGSKEPLSKEGVMLSASYEAEQHLLHFGRSDEPMCWTICGLTSGYISRTAGKEIYVLEDGCMGRGDAGCHLLGRTREEWGDERARGAALLRAWPSQGVPRRFAPSGHRDIEGDRAEAARASPSAGASGPGRRGAPGDHCQERGDGATRGPGAAGRQVRRHRAHHRRERVGQGADRAPDPRRVDALDRAVHRGQLRRHHRDPPRKRALRPRARRLHRRKPGSARPVRGRQQRNVAARRSRRDFEGNAGEAAARAPGAGDPAGRREQEPADRFARPGRDQPGSLARRRRRQLSTGSLLPA